MPSQYLVLLLTVLLHQEEEQLPKHQIQHHQLQNNAAPPANMRQSEQTVLGLGGEP